MQDRDHIDESIQWDQIQRLNAEFMAIFAQEFRETADGTVYLSRIEKDRVSGPEIDGTRVSTMSSKQRKLVQEGFDEVKLAEEGNETVFETKPAVYWIS